ncbi:MAG: hypothetical protein ACK59B_17755, partial [Alphaproteobacteria bacterium]
NPTHEIQSTIEAHSKHSDFDWIDRAVAQTSIPTVYAFPIDYPPLVEGLTAARTYEFCISHTDRQEK